MKALVLGATGAVGRDLLEQLLLSDAFEEVHIFVRREVRMASAKLTVHVVDFNHPEAWASELAGDVLFSTMGTTIRAAGSQKEQWKVDYTYQLEAAENARKNGVPAYVLVSSIGANAKSKVFYSKMKGQLDEAVMELGFPGCFILRPPSLVRKGSDRFGEKAGVAILRCLNAVGLMRSLTPMPTEEVAASMIRCALSGKSGATVLEAQDILCK